MIDPYTANPSSGQRTAIVPEECGLPYRLRKLDLAAGGAARDAGGRVTAADRRRARTPTASRPASA